MRRQKEAEMTKRERERHRDETGQWALGIVGNEREEGNRESKWQDSKSESKQKGNSVTCLNKIYVYISYIYGPV